MTQLEILEEIEAVDFAEEEEDIEGESANQKKLQLKEIWLYRTCHVKVSTTHACKAYILKL
ncbi:hypothetical protein [Microcystis aeruginosa]|uniref:hypothetical protein n=1 Tax=Microcystis aeruginosa TaxID=1126 RepID=UPI002330C7B5|nr:hypothetical protein [Microcystis aeruginosa]MDB9416419.1 hypothetical protein [Microcystis aeruginosa CS-556/03]